jgi:hypothetical protein
MGVGRVVWSTPIGDWRTAKGRDGGERQSILFVRGTKNNHEVVAQPDWGSRVSNQEEACSGVDRCFCFLPFCAAR